jgi:hypothetical protein
MKKKKEKKRARTGERRREFIAGSGWSVHACNLHKMQRAAEWPELFFCWEGVRVGYTLATRASQLA